MCKLVSTIIVALVCVWSCHTAFNEANARALHQPPSKQAKRSTLQLTEAERALVTSSRKAIVRTGISESYFDRHFAVIKVVNQPGDRRVVWKFSINEYETTVSDSFGYYTENGKRVDTHSVTAFLKATSEIKRTISKGMANQIMQRCIGRFANPSVEYRSTGSGAARLVLTAEAVPKSARRQKEEEREREEREARERKAKAKTGQDTDVLEEEEKEGPPIVTASVDLENGKCTKGQLLVAP